MSDFKKTKRYIVTETDDAGGQENQVALRDGTMAKEGRVIMGDHILHADIQGPELLKTDRIEEMVQKKGTTKTVRASEAKKNKGGK